MREAVRDGNHKLPNSRDLLRLPHSIICNPPLNSVEVSREMKIRTRRARAWVSNADDDPFREATGAFYYFVTARWLSKKHSALPRKDFITALQNPDTGTFGRGAVCMVHKVAQEASRRMTPARALAHAVAPPLDRTFDSPVTTASVTRL